jgi:hypothetical protein
MATVYRVLLQTFVPRPISSDRAYKRALKQVEFLMRKRKRSRAEDDMIDLLATRRGVSKANAVRLGKFFHLPADEFIAADS